MLFLGKHILSIKLMILGLVKISILSSKIRFDAGGGIARTQRASTPLDAEWD